MPNIEVEVRSFITKEQYDKLLDFFKSKAKLVKEDNQETYYFDAKEDLRIQRNSKGAKIWMKKGKIHDDYREETEIKISRDDFDRTYKLFRALGYKIKVEWFRKRFQFDWGGIKTCLDYTKGYGYIIELEKLVDEKDKEKTLDLLKQKLKGLEIPLTSREEFQKKFDYYLENWKELIKG